MNQEGGVEILPIVLKLLPRLPFFFLSFGFFLEWYIQIQHLSLDRNR